MCGETSVILVAWAADFFFDGSHLEVPTDVTVRHIPRYVDYYAQGLWLKAFEDLDVWCGCCAPELDAVSPQYDGKYDAEFNNQ
jgi:hypothetical protein